MALETPPSPLSGPQASVAHTAAREGDPPPRNLLAWVVPLVLVIGVLLRLEILARPMTELAGRFLIDDSYIALDIARSIANGQGPAAGGQPTNGFQPLWIVLLTPLYWVLGEPAMHDVDVQDLGVRLGLGLGFACDLALLTAIFFALRRQGRSDAPSFYLVATYWALSPRVWQTTFNGLETVLVLALFYALSAWRDRLHDGSQTHPERLGGITGLLCALLLLARVDQAIALLAFFGLERRRFRDARFLAGCAVGFAVPIVAWSLWIHGWTGYVYPVSGEASRLQSMPSPEFVPRVRFHLFIVWNELLRPALWLIAAAGVASVWVGLTLGGSELRRLLREQALSMLTLLGLVVTYVGFQGGWWYFGRYLALLDWVVVLWLGGLLDAVVRHRPSVLLPLRFGAVLLAASLAVLHPLRERYTFVTPPGMTEKSYRGVALWARDAMPPGAVVGAVQSGALGYYATPVKVINLDGVTNPDALRAIKERRLVAYALEQDVDYFLGTHGNFAFLRDHEADPALAARFVAVGEGPEDGFVRGRWIVFFVSESS